MTEKEIDRDSQAEEDEEESTAGHEGNKGGSSSRQSLLIASDAKSSARERAYTDQDSCLEDGSCPGLQHSGPLVDLLSRKRLICTLLATLSILVLLVVLGVGTGSIANGYGDLGLVRPANQVPPGHRPSLQTKPQSKQTQKPHPPQQQQQQQQQQRPHAYQPNPAPVLEQSYSKAFNETTPKGLPSTPAAAFCTTWSNETVIEIGDDPKLKRPLPSPLNVTLPRDFKVIGLIFFGRPRTVDILDCYLQQNLVSNGGVMEEVHFVAHTDRGVFLDWLDELVSMRPGYKRINVPKKSGYSDIWRLHGSDPNTMYIKIDDDITWLEKDAIPRLVQSRVNHKEPLVIAANLINSPVTSWLHYRMGAIYAYLPETEHIIGHGSKGTWRPSELPTYYETAPRQPAGPERVNNWKVPYEGHRWLPMRHREDEVWRTPINAAEPNQFSPSWKSWGIAAQQHMSLFENIEKAELWRYVLLNNEGMLNTQYKRYNLNFVAVWGSDIAENVPFGGDDEEALTVTLPRKLGRPLLIDTSVLVGHFSFFTQAMGMAQTDILDRYRAYANEAICAADNQKLPLDRQCNDF